LAELFCHAPAFGFWVVCRGVVPKTVCLLAGIVAKPTNGIRTLGKKSARGAQVVLEMLKVIREAAGDLGVGDSSDTLHVLLNGEIDLQEPMEPVKDVVRRANGPIMVRWDGMVPE